MSPQSGYFGVAETPVTQGQATPERGSLAVSISTFEDVETPADPPTLRCSPIPTIPHVLGRLQVEILIVEGCRKRQTATATPAEPGDLPRGLDILFDLRQEPTRAERLRNIIVDPARLALSSSPLSA